MDHNHDGGYVRRSMPFPYRPGTIAVLGTWSGGSWENKGFPVTQYRGKHVIGIWRVTGVDVIPQAGRPPVLLMKSESSGSHGFEPGDVVTFGSDCTTYTSYDIEIAKVPTNGDASILFGSSKIHGVLCVNDEGLPSRVLLFHGTTERMPLSKTHSVWWRDRQYTVTIKQDPVETLEVQDAND